MWEPSYTWGRASKEDQATEVASTLVAEGARGIDQSADAIGLNSTPNKRRSPGSGSACSLFGFEKVFSGVGLLSAVISLTEDGR